MSKLELLLLHAAESVGLELSGDVVVVTRSGSKPLINFVMSVPMKVIIVLSPELERMMK